jgi:hypothetical protein
VCICSQQGLQSSRSQTQAKCSGLVQQVRAIPAAGCLLCKLIVPLSSHLHHAWRRSRCPWGHDCSHVLGQADSTACVGHPVRLKQQFCCIICICLPHHPYLMLPLQLTCCPCCRVSAPHDACPSARPRTPSSSSTAVQLHMAPLRAALHNSRRQQPQQPQRRHQRSAAQRQQHRAHQRVWQQ